MFSQAPALRYSDVNEEVTVQADASLARLGAVPLQRGKPDTFTTGMVHRYNQIRKKHLHSSMCETKLINVCMEVSW